MANNYGLNDSYLYTELELDSLDADGPASSGASKLDWPIFSFEPQQNVYAFKILEVQIPFSYYVISTENQTFIWSNGITTYAATIPIGNYTTTTLTPALTTALNASLPGSSRTFTVTYSDLTGKLTFAATGAFSFQFGAPTNSGNKNPRLILGFPGGETFSSGLTLVAPNAALVTGPNYIYVNSQQLGGLVQAVLPAGAVNLANGGRGPQVAKVGVNANPSGVILWSDPDPQKWFSLQDIGSLNSLDFYLTLGNNSAQTPLRLNGLSFSIKVGLLLLGLDKMETLGGLPQQDHVTKRFRSY
jgi:hypothetical protein